MEINLNKIGDKIYEKDGLKGLLLGAGILVIGYGVITLLSNGFDYSPSANNLSLNNNAQINGATLISGNNNIVDQSHNSNILVPTPYQEQKEKIWDQAKFPIQTFFEKLDNKDYTGARQQLSGTSFQTAQFSETELRDFGEHIDGHIRIQELTKNENAQIDGEAASRSFYVGIWYQSNATVKEDQWYIMSTKIAGTENQWKISKMYCNNEQCNRSRLAQINF